MEPILKQEQSEHRLAVVRAGFHHGQRKAGVDVAPDHLLTTPLLKRLNAKAVIQSHPIAGSVPFVKHELPYYLHEPEAVAANARGVYESCRSAMELHDQLLVVGGDHSIAMGSVAAHLVAASGQNGLDDFAVLWVDAHADLHKLTSTTSGNIHGCPVSFLLGDSGMDLAIFSEWFPKGVALKPTNLAYIGLRDVDAPEEAFLQHYGIKHWRNTDVQAMGIDAVMAALRAHWGPDKRVYVSFDIDALDPSIAPATGTPVPNGLSLGDGEAIIKAVRRDYRAFLGMDLVEVNPLLAKDQSELDSTIAAGQRLIEVAFDQ